MVQAGFAINIPGNVLIRFSAGFSVHKSSRTERSLPETPMYQ